LPRNGHRIAVKASPTRLIMAVSEQETADASHVWPVESVGTSR